MIINTSTSGIIWVDYRENKSKVPQLLKDLDLDVRIVNNQIIDYVLGVDIGVERKTYADFIASIRDKRLFNQVMILKENFSYPLLIIEGRHNKKYCIANKNILRGIYIYVMVKQRVPIMRTANEEATSKIIYDLTKYINRSGKMFSPMYYKRKAVTLKEKRKRILESFPGIGLETSREILINFSSLTDFFLSEVEVIMEVKGIGQKKAQSIKEILN